MPEKFDKIVKRYLNQLSELAKNSHVDAEKLKKSLENKEKKSKDVNTLVASYFDNLGNFSKKSKSILLLLAKVIHSTKSIDFEKARIVQRINNILEEFDLLHREHVKDFWEIWLPQLLNVENPENPRPKLLAIELKEAFYVHRNNAVSIVKDLSNTAKILISLCEKNQIEHKKEELLKLKDLTLEMIIDAWEKDLNPITGELYDDIIRE